MYYDNNITDNNFNKKKNIIAQSPNQQLNNGIIDTNATLQKLSTDPATQSYAQKNSTNKIISNVSNLAKQNIDNATNYVTQNKVLTPLFNRQYEETPFIPIEQNEANAPLFNTLAGDLVRRVNAQGRAKMQESNANMFRGLVNDYLGISTPKQTTPYEQALTNAKIETERARQEDFRNRVTSDKLKQLETLENSDVGYNELNDRDKLTYQQEFLNTGQKPNIKVEDGFLWGNNYKLDDAKEQSVIPQNQEEQEIPQDVSELLDNDPDFADKRFIGFDEATGLYKFLTTDGQIVLYDNRS